MNIMDFGRRSFVTWTEDELRKERQEDEMTIISGTGSIRSDCQHLAKCEKRSRYYCRLYCDNRPQCSFLTIGRPKTATVEARGKYKDSWAKRNREKVNHSRRVLKIRRAEWLDKLKRERGCCICGYSKCSKSIDSHHIEKKEYTISTMCRLTFSFKRIIKELKKCVFVCKNCHYEVHYGISQIPKNARRAQ